MIKISLADPLPNYSDIMLIMIPLIVIVVLFIGIYYFWYYNKTKGIVTLWYAFGFTAVGIGILIPFLLDYIFIDIGNSLSSSWDYDTLFQTGGMIAITMSLAVSSTYIKITTEKTRKTIRYSMLVITIIVFIFMIINSFLMITDFNFGSWLTRVFAIWDIIFYTYISLKEKNYRLLTIGIAFIFSTIGGIMMAEYSGTGLGVLGNIFQLIFSGLIFYGLFFMRRREE
ncbi:MAG: hypothetical protein GF317_13205 [Candidatus Lokiarchaeota archaeon]|nr:hypothetical protein [Candidatus Lokiarchaeota archaeon]MBD3200594.1 hypothetical protein [Candidatus Lokiarchaeota archaeon]